MTNLRSIIATPDGKRRHVRTLFATIADHYDFITRFLSYGQDRRWKHKAIALAEVAPHHRVLDLACGTGDLLFEAAARSRQAIGVDVTHRMLQLARRRLPQTSAERIAEARAVEPGLVTADMLALPFGAECFDVVTIGYGLRNVPDLRAAIREAHRVLAPGGRLVSLDFNRPQNPLVRRAYLAYLTVVGSALGLALHRDPDTYRYIPESIRNYPGAHGVAALLEQQGFVNVRIVKVLGGLMTIHVALKEPGTRNQEPGTRNQEPGTRNRNS